MSHEHDAPPLPTPAQCRAARAVLELTVTDVCEAAEVSRGTLVKFEAGGEVRAVIGERLRVAFEARGVTFAPDGRGMSW